LAPGEPSAEQRGAVGASTALEPGGVCVERGGGLEPGGLCAAAGSPSGSGSRAAEPGGPSAELGGPFPEPANPSASGSLSASIVNLCEQIGHLLTAANQTIALAESCTGGLIAGALTEVPGSSGYFGYGVVSYSNGAKMKLLKVREETLASYGAVSPQTAIEMAEGVRSLAGSDYGLSVTGIAGPGGGSAAKPVGLVYVGFSSAAGTEWLELRLKGSRHEIRQATVQAALTFALSHIAG